LDRGARNVRLVDDCGNLWFCTLMHVYGPNANFKIGGQWKRMVLARRLIQRSRIVVGAPNAENNNTVYFKVVRG